VVRNYELYLNLVRCEFAEPPSVISSFPPSLAIRMDGEEACLWLPSAQRNDAGGDTETNVGARADEVCTVKRRTKKKTERFRWSSSFVTLFSEILFKSKSLLGKCFSVCVLPSG
jgi:hypothetical protein